MGEANRKRWAQEQERLRLKEMAWAQAKPINAIAPLIDETYTGGPSSGMSLQRPDGGGEMHVGLTVLDQYALVALRAFIQRGVGFEKVDAENTKLNTETLAAVSMAVARDCIVQRRLIPVAVATDAGDKDPPGDEPAAESPVDEVAAAKAKTETPAPEGEPTAH
jgi:hypothetical protein